MNESTADPVICSQCRQPIPSHEWRYHYRGAWWCHRCNESRLETYETTQPWVTYTYRTPDAAIPDSGGVSEIEMLCCICGDMEVAQVDVPPIGTPDPPAGYKHPQREAFLEAHVHRLQNQAPETWKLPLRNPAAHSDTLDILRGVAEKVRRGTTQDDRERAE